MAEQPTWVKDWLAQDHKKSAKPLSENMQKKMNGTSPKVKEDAKTS